MKTALVIGTSVALAAQLIADENDFARAAVRWQRCPSLTSAFHLATSGVFLAKDVAALG